MKKTNRRTNQVPQPSNDLTYSSKEITIILNEGEKLDLEEDNFLTLGRKNFSYQEQVFPTNKISHIISIGNAVINNDLIQYCLTNTIPIIYLNPDGTFRGKLDSNFTNLQVSDISPERAIWLGQCFAYGAVKNLKTYILRFLRHPKLKTKPEGIDSYLKRLANIQQESLYYKRESPNEIRGIIGEAYKNFYTQILPNFIFAGDWQYTKNSSPLSLAINFAETLLTEQTRITLIKNEINPTIGVINSSIRNNGLAADLGLEYKPWIFSLITRLINKKQLTFKKFDNWFTGEPLPNSVKAIIIKEYRTKLNEQIKLSNYTTSYSNTIDIQSRQIKLYLQGKHDEYAPIKYN